MTTVFNALGTAAPETAAAPSATPIADMSAAVSEAVHGVGDAAMSLFVSLPIWGVNLLLAGAVILLGALFIRLGRRVITRVFKRRAGKAQHGLRQNETLKSLIQSVFSYIMYFIIVTAVLGVFGVNLASVLAVAGVGGVALAFGAQTLVKDIISGVFLWGEGNVVVGDVVEIGGLSGEVETVALRTTSVRNVNGNLYIIPNGEIRTVVNMSRSFKRALIDVPVPYEERLDRVIAILRDEMERVPDAVPKVYGVPEVQGVLKFDSIGLTVRIMVECPVGENWRIERELRKRVKDRFDKEGISMPHVTRYIPQGDMSV